MNEGSIVRENDDRKRQNMQYNPHRRNFIIDAGHRDFQTMKKEHFSRFSRFIREFRIS